MSAYGIDFNYLRLWNCCVPFVRFWGIFTALVYSSRESPALAQRNILKNENYVFKIGIRFGNKVICGVGVDVFMHHHFMGIYIIVASFIILFLETMWAITIFIKICVRNINSKIFSIWNIILKIKFWKKSVIYSALSVALLLKPHNLWLSSVAGAMLVTLALFHLILSFQTQRKNKGKESLLQNEDNYLERNEEVIFEVLDNTIKPKEEVSVEEPGGNVLEI